MNRGEMRNRILDGLNDSFTSPVSSSAAQINDVITEASEVLAEEVEAIPRTIFTPLREGVTYFYTPALASDMMVPMRLWNPTTNRRLTAIDLRQLDEHNRGWEAVTGNPEVWASLSWDVFAIYPHPATGGGVLRIDYLAWPRELLDDDDELEFPLSAHDGAVLYGIYDGLLKRQDVKTAVEVLNQFTDIWKQSAQTSGIKRTGGRIFSRTHGGPNFRSRVSEEGVA